MDYQRRSNGLITFLEHWWFFVLAVIAFLSSQLLMFFTRLIGARWIWCYGISLAVAAIGVSLIFYSKIPLYQQRRFFTLGSGALPESGRPFYRRGYHCVIFAVALLSCLLLSRP